MACLLAGRAISFSALRPLGNCQARCMEIIACYRGIERIVWLLQCDLFNH
jgi:hypothetical protein